ncbi:MAG TPA: hypothetical protein VNV42_04475 [Solirubrobacteraceae bacterium]|jgi:hypothetical protein|nr:hypothetical protein [Solirubrobacteraceae bacterium]
MGEVPYRPIKEIENLCARGDLRLAVAIDYARETGHPIPLAGALGMLAAIVRESPGEYDAWACRWLSRWLAERNAPTIAKAAELAALLAALPEEPAALDALRRAL